MTEQGDDVNFKSCTLRYHSRPLQDNVCDRL